MASPHLTYEAAKAAGFQVAEARRIACGRQFQTSLDRDAGTRITALLLLDIPAVDGGLKGLPFTALMLATWQLRAEDVIAAGGVVVGHPAPAAPLARAA
ncbi:hypothetical protein [Methylobacterium sp. CCH5-D2]|uniref:hypothetical protein n=1 Tax=Methylobacterium sp. CCH5-D2 TaxID=1768765 RepID=UPI000837333C|nr:hypothetical protein [Methylobacterium sp. CCH5-D2]